MAAQSHRIKLKEMEENRERRERKGRKRNNERDVYAKQMKWNGSKEERNWTETLT